MKILWLFLLVSTLSFSNQQKTVMNSQIEKINKEIANKKEEVKKIDSQTKTIEEQIADIKKDIDAIRKDKEIIEKDIQSTLKNIDYGNINLSYSSDELKRQEAEFYAKIIAWNRREARSRNFQEELFLKKQFSELLAADLEEISRIKSIQDNINTVSANIKSEQTKLTVLRNQLNYKISEIAKKEAEQRRLIAKLNSQKKQHIVSISSLEKEKARIQREIENILTDRFAYSKAVGYDTALKTIGQGTSPLPNGKVVVNFKEQKTKTVISNGVEISAKLGSPIYSTHDGKVIYKGKIQGLGQVIMINYGANVIGVYGNLIHSFVSIDKTVKKGQPIGILGLSIDEKSVLYYETRLNLKPINPLNLY